MPYEDRVTSPMLRFWFAAESGEDGDARRPDAPVVLHRSHASSESTLVSCIQGGDEHAFAELYRTYFDALWTFARTLLRTNDGAKDVVQDVFLSLWLQRTRWVVTTTVQGYLFGAVRNRALKVLRHDRSGVRAVEHAEHPESRPDEPAPDVLAAASELEWAVAHVIETLPERQRTAVELKWRHDLSWAEVGDAMGISKIAAWKLGLAAQRRLLPLRDRFGGG
jgi:RNA polymerase sigma-70 factor (ECF subfamily)